MARSSKLETRIVSMLDATRPHLPIDRMSGRLILSLSTALILALSAITVDNSKVVADEPDQSKAKTPDEKQAESPKAVATDAEKEKPSAAAVSGRDDVDEAQTTIQQVLSTRNVQYANVGTHFAGSSTGGICFVAASPDVQKELELDDATAVKVRSISLDFRMRRLEPSIALIRGNRDLNSTSNLTRDEVKQKRRELLDKYNEDMKKVDDKIYEEVIPQLRAALTEQQRVRLQQIAWQAYGSHDMAIDPELTKAMELKPDQVEKIAAINNEYLKKVAELHRERAFMVKHLELDKERDAKAVGTSDHRATGEICKTRRQSIQSFPCFALPPAWQTTAVKLPIPSTVAGIFRTTGNVGIFKVAEHPAVQKELGISPDVAEKINDIKDQFAAVWQDAGGAVRQGFTMRNGTRQNIQDPVMPPLMMRSRGNSPEEREKAIAKMVQVWHATTAQFQPKLKDVLTPEQYTRLRQINWQTMGSAAFFEHDVIQALTITQEQQDKIAAIDTEYRPQIQRLQMPQGSRVQRVGNSGWPQPQRCPR